MKVILTTLTGQKFELDVEAEDTVRNLKGSLYQTGKVSSQVRLLQGQSVLHDDRKLSEYQIQDGAVISALFEPDVDVNIEITTARKTFTITTPNSTRVCEVKVKLVDIIECGIDAEEIDLLFDDTKLENDLPLHFFGITTGTKLHLLRPFVNVKIEDNHGDILFRRINRKDTILDVKNKLRESQVIVGDNKMSYSGHPEDMRLYLVEDAGNRYKELADKKSIDQYKIRDNSRLYLLSYRWTNPSRNKDINIFMWNRKEMIEGVEKLDTPLAVKLRTQDQLGLPTNTLRLVTKNNVEDHIKMIVLTQYYIATEEDVRAERMRRKEQLEEEIKQPLGKSVHSHKYRIKQREELADLNRLLHLDQ